MAICIETLGTNVVLELELDTLEQDQDAEKRSRSLLAIVRADES